MLASKVVSTAWVTVLAVDADKIVASDPVCHSSDRFHWRQDNHDELHVVCVRTRGRQGRLVVSRNAVGVWI